MFNDSWLWENLEKVDEQLQGFDGIIQQQHSLQYDSDVVSLEYFLNLTLASNLNICISEVQLQGSNCKHQLNIQNFSATRWSCWPLNIYLKTFIIAQDTCRVLTSQHCFTSGSICDHYFLIIQCVQVHKM